FPSRRRAAPRRPAWCPLARCRWAAIQGRCEGVRRGRRESALPTRTRSALGWLLRMAWYIRLLFAFKAKTWQAVCQLTHVRVPGSPRSRRIGGGCAARVLRFGRAARPRRDDIHSRLAPQPAQTRLRQKKNAPGRKTSTLER